MAGRDFETFVSSEMDWLTTVRARLGLTVGNALAYVTGGLALAHLEYSGMEDEEVHWDGVSVGFATGAGVEVKLTDCLSLKGEYLFVKMDQEHEVYGQSPQIVEFSNRSQQARIGLNYYFGG
jgi:outer membrane immunogenic protein